MLKFRTVFIAVLLAVVLLITISQNNVWAQRPGEPHQYVVAIDSEYAPYEFVDATGQPAGFNIDLLQRIGELSGTTFRFIPMPWPEAVARLENGSVDLVNMIQTPKRAARYEFSEPHSQIAQAIFVTTGSGIYGLDTLSGHTVALQKNDISLEMLAGREDFERLIVHSKEEGMLLLNAGQVEAFFAAEQPGLALIRRYKLDHVFIGDVGLFPNPYGFAARKGNSALIETLNQGLDTLKASGEYERLTEQWFQAEPVPSSWLVRHERGVINASILMALLLITAGIWVGSLEQRVRQRTRSLKESEARFRNFYENVNDLIYCTDYRGTITDINPALERLTGYRREEIIGRKIDEFFVNPGDQQTLDAILEAEGAINDYEILLRDKDGREIYVSASARVIFDEHGQPVATEGALRDISARKALEAARQQQLRFSNGLNQIAAKILAEDEPQSLLAAAITIIGNILEVDWALIYDINFEKDQAIGLCKWLNPDAPEIQATLDTYPLAMFIGGAEAMRRTRHWLESHAGQVNPHFAEDGSAEILHGQMNIQSLLWFPFAFYEQGYYTIVLNQVSRRRVWQEDEIAFIDSLARQIELALDKIQRLEVIADHANRLGVLSASIDKLNRSGTETEMLAEIGEAAMKVGQCQRAAIWTLHTDGSASCPWSRGLSASYIGKAIAQVAQMPGDRLRNFPKAILLPDTAALPEDAVLRQLAGKEGYRAVGLWPLVFEGRTIAAIGCYFDHPHNWRASEMEALESLASQAAAALQNARLFEETSRRANEFATLLEISRTMDAGQNTATLLKQIVEAARDLLSATASGMYRYDAARQELEVVVATDSNIPPGLRLKVGEGLAGQVALTRETIIVDDYTIWSSRADSFEGIPVRAVVEAPILFGGELLGVLVVHEVGDSTHTFTQRDANLLSMLASQTAAVLYNNRLLEKLQYRFAESETLRQAVKVVTSTLNLEQASHQILEQLAEVVPYDSASVMLLRRDNGNQYLEIVSGRGWENPEEVIGLHFPVPGDNPNSEVVASGKPLVLNDTGAAYPAFQQEPHSHIQSWLGVALISEQETIGMLSIDSQQKFFFTPEHIRLASTYADHVAAAVQHAILYEETRRRASRAQHIARVAGELIQAGDFSSFWNTLLNAALHILEADRTAIYQYDRQNDRIHCEHAVGISQGYLQQINKTFQQIPGSRLLSSTNSVIIKDVQTDPKTAPIQEAIRQEGFHSVSIFPLVDAEGSFAAFTVYRNDIRPFSADEVIAGETLGHLASYAYQNHSLLRAERRQRRYAEALSEAGFDLSQSLELEPVLDRLLTHILNVVPFDAACVRLVDEKSGEARAVRASGYEQFGTEIARNVEERILMVSETANLRRMAASGEALIVPDTAADPDWITVPAAAHVRSWLGAPLRAYGRLVGFFSLDKLEPGFYQPEHAQKLSAFAGQAAIAIENSRLFEETRRRAAQMALVHRLSQRVTAILDVDELLQTAADELHASFGYLSVQFYLLDELQGELEARGVAGQPGLVKPGYRQKVGEGITGRAAAQGERLLVDDVRQIPDFIACVPGIRSELVLPIRSGGKIRGVLNLESDQVRGFDEVDITTLESFCGQVGAALENARLFQETNRRVEEQQVIADTAAALREAEDLASMIPILIRQAAEIAGAQFGSIFLEERPSETPAAMISQGWYAAENGWETPITAELHMEPGEGITGRVMASGEVYLATHLPSDPVIKIDPGEEKIIHQFQSVVSLTLRTQKRTVGALHLGFDHPYKQHGRISHLLQTISTMAGNALQRARLHEQLEENYIQTIMALANAMDARDSYTGEHSKDLARWAEAVARRLGCCEAEIETIRWGALLHDIGKIGVPDAILRKPGKLNKEERKIIKRHPEIGAQIVAPVGKLWQVAPIIHAHQEKFDGSGYPNGLCGEEIPLGGRILAVVDAYSAITDERPYKKARSHKEAVAELRRCTGAHFDPQVVEVFLKFLDEEQTTREEN